MDKEPEINPELWRELRNERDAFLENILAICAKYGVDMVPMSANEILTFFDFPLSKLMDNDFRREIERKIKRRKKELNPVYRWFRKLWGK